MIIDTETAYSMGFNDYGYNDECPYIYEDLIDAWWNGWIAAQVTVMAYYDDKSLAYSD